MQVVRSPLQSDGRLRFLTMAEMGMESPDRARLASVRRPSANGEEMLESSQLLPGRMAAD